MFSKIHNKEKIQKPDQLMEICRFIKGEIKLEKKVIT